MTDGKGRADLSIPVELPYVGILVDAEGYMPRRVTLSSSEALVHVLLARAERIEGRVLNNADGGATGSDLMIFAWLAREYIAEDEFRLARLLLGTHRVHVATTDAEGHFICDGLERGKRYYLSAIGDGWCTPVLLTAAAPSTGVLLRVDRAAVAAVQLVEVGGATLQADRELVQGVRSWQGLEGALHLVRRPMLRNDIQAFLPRSFARADIHGRNTVCNVFVVDPSCSGPVRVGYTVQVPGYRLAEGEFETTPLGAAVDWQYLQCEPVRLSWGNARILFKNLPAGQGARLAEDRPLAVVRFMPQEAHSTADGFGGLLYGNADAVHGFDGIPEGRYSLQLEFQDPDMYLEAQPMVDVRPTQVARVEVDMRGYGSLMIFVEELDGRPYAGPASFLIRSEKGHGFASFLHPPYYVSALAPGRCIVEMRSKEGLNDVGALQGEETVVQAGFEATIVLTRP